MKKAYNDIIERLVKAVEKGDTIGWSMPWETEPPKYPHTVKPNAHAEKILNAYYKHERITFVEKEQDKSFYSPNGDMIMLPAKAQFKSTESYYSVKAHETIHSTGDYTRCNRAVFDEYKSFSFGDSRYSREELVAEVGACFLLLELGIDTTQAEKSATAYISNWLTHLNNNTNWIYRAGELSADAVEYILESSER